MNVGENKEAISSCYYIRVILQKENLALFKLFLKVPYLFQKRQRKVTELAKEI